MRKKSWSCTSYFLLAVLPLVFWGCNAAHLANPEQDKPISEAFWLDGKWPHEKSQLPRHDTARYGRLANGFRYIIEQKDMPKEKISIHLVVQAGSLMERDNELGVAHFLEHLAFNGSRHFPPDQLIPFFQKNGMAFGKDANAHTSFLETVYKLDLADTSHQNIDKALLFFRDVADGLDIDPVQVSKERGVILSEKAARDSVKHQAGRRLAATLFKGTRFVNAPIGLESVIREVQASTIREFYKAWYRPELMYIAVAGDIKDGGEVEKRIKTMFEDFKAMAPRRSLESWGNPDHSGVTAYYDPYDANSILVRIQTCPARQFENDSIAVQQRQVYQSLVSSMLNSRFQAQRALGNAPFIMAMAGMPDTFGLLPGAFVQGVTTQDQWEQCLTSLSTHLAQALTYGFLPGEVKTAKLRLLRSIQRLTRLARSMENPIVLKTLETCINANRVYQSWDQTLEMYTRIIEKIGPDDLTDFFRNRWEKGGRFVSLSGNCDIGDRETGRKKLETLFLADQARQVKPPAQQAPVTFPYLLRHGNPGQVDFQTSRPIPGTDLTLWETRYKNGLLLRMVPTPFTKGTVSMHLHLGQGSDGVKDADYNTARLGFMADGLSGFGHLTLEGNRRLTALYGVQASSALQKYATMVTGSGETGQLSKIMDAMWAQYMDPSFEKRHLKEALKRLHLADKNRGKNVPSVAGELSRPFFYGDGLRTRPMTLAHVKDIDFDTLLSLHKKLHKANRPVLNVVGDFEPGQVQALAAGSFGLDSLCYPDPENRASLSQPKVFPDKSHRKKSLVVPANLNQAELRMAWYRPLEKVDNRRQILVRRLTAALIRDRLRSGIREDKGASYSPVMGYRSDDDTGYGLYFVKISTQPDTLPGLEGAVSDILRDMAATPVTREELQRQTAPMIQAWKKSQRQNRPLMARLDLMARHDRPYLDWASNWGQWAGTVTPEEINREIHAAFIPDNLAVLSITEKKRSLPHDSM